MGDFKVDKDAFKRRMKKLYAAWKEASEGDPLNQVDALVVAVGTVDVVYCKSLSVQTWLFGYELPDTIMALCKSSVLVLSSKEKIKFVQSVKGSSKDGSIPPLKLLVKDKNDKDTSTIETIINAIKASSKGNTIGVFSKDKFPGDFLDSWKKAVDEAAFEKVDISAPIALVMAPKEDLEVSLIKKACKATMDLYNKYVREQLVDIIDKKKRVKHSTLADRIEQAAQNNEYFTGLEMLSLDTYYQPKVQSGGKYELELRDEVGDNILHFGSIVCMLGLRYESYCSNITRTLMVDPTQEMQANYALLLKAQGAAIAALRHGVKLSEVYDAAVKTIKSEKPELVDKSTKNAGFGMGLEFRESSMLISPKTDVVAVKGMVFNLNLGFSDLLNKDAKDDKGKIYSLFIGDTILVNDESASGTVLTPQKRQTKHAFIFLKEEQEEEEEEEKEEEEEEEKSKGRSQRGAIVPNRTRTEMTAEEKRQEHQKRLAEKVQKEALERNAGHREKEDEKKNRKVSISYKNENYLPSEPEISELKVYVDKKHETVVVPFHGKQVPFHIATIKNISQSVEGDHTCLRINFFHAGSNLGRNDGLIYPMENEKFLKEMVLRSSNSKEPGEISSAASNLKRAHDSIKEVQKKFKSREAEEREKEGVMKQDSLINSPSAGNPKLNNVYIRPNILSKTISGVLEAHTNGLRFTSVKNYRVDILYNNIKKAFFQPCDNELIILVHFHLKNAILFGKKKHIDVQFYTVVGEVITNFGKHQYSHDRDDLRAEQSERVLRNKLKETFMTFCNKVSAKGDIKFEIPVRELGFQGAPKRSMVLIQPTDGCLVNLTEWPPFVVTLKEVEVVHFERVHFQLKNFDMVLVFKDYHKKVAMISQVPMTNLDHVKEWLNTCDIKYSEGILSLNWTKIMETITDDPAKFLNDGGWEFLDPESVLQEENDDDDDDDEDDAYSPSDSGSEEESSEGDSEDSNWSAEEDDDDSEELGSSEESGKDWDELEEEAKRDDAKKYKKVQPTKKPKHKSSSKHKSPEKKHKSPHKDHKHKNEHASRDEKSSLKRKHHERDRKR